ncbi:uncharacterized protein LOC126375791 [Pectinophora gossypiella]|uniref:uncharacterized protein LOC126375791 n=1 Tax=Pectinophora gossypiella TaxID=13191 RepID=UPI00214E512D|nr:uncharacterized protein LOC126375791 [Pectinophora gossypiella]
MTWIQRIFMLFLCALNLQHGQKCRLHTRIHFGEPLPVILKDGRLLEPTDNFGNIEIDYGDTITLSCEGAGFISHPNIRSDKTTATITCDGGETFKNDEWLSLPAQFTLFKCSFPPNYISRRTDRTCFDGNRIYEVGYRIENIFYPAYESCFNELGFNAIYSKYTQKPYNAHYQTKVERPFFVDNNVYGIIPVNTLFSTRGQKAAVAQLVGPLIDKYMTQNQFLSRGHLAAKTDFVLAFGERATFHYVNCAPQWHGFNSGNWNTLEIDLRNHIHLAGYDTIIYTGTFGVSTLLNQFDRRVEIYLYTDENNNPVIPVPEYFYKVVYEPATQRGTAFVGINNPYYTEAEARELFFCEDVCRRPGQYPWLTWHPDNSHDGYTFCCTISDFRQTVPHLPKFKVTGLLI